MQGGGGNGALAHYEQTVREGLQGGGGELYRRTMSRQSGDECREAATAVRVQVHHEQTVWGCRVMGLPCQALAGGNKQGGGGGSGVRSQSEHTYSKGTRTGRRRL